MRKHLKNKTISVRITEAQLINLTNALKHEQIKTSEFLRECVEVCGNNYRIHEIKNNSELLKEKLDFNIENPK